MVQPLKLVI